MWLCELGREDELLVATRLRDGSRDWMNGYQRADNGLINTAFFFSFPIASRKFRDCPKLVIFLCLSPRFCPLFCAKIEMLREIFAAVGQRNDTIPENSLRANTNRNL